MRDEKHLAFLRTLMCVVCLDNISVEAAHLRMSDGRICKPVTGIGIKPPDYFCLPLCSEHHREQHSMSERKFWVERNIDPTLLSLMLYAVSGDAQEAERIIRGMHVPILIAG